MNLQGLIQGDSALSHLSKVTPDLAQSYLFRARINDYIDQIQNAATPKGLMIPFYEKYITLVKPEEQAAAKNNLIESYRLLGSWYADKDKVKAIDYLNKCLALDPTDSYATTKLKELTGAGAAAKPKGK